MTKYQITIVELRDLESLLMTCGNGQCQTKVTLRLEARSTVPATCPSCGTPYSKEYRQAVVNFLEVHLALNNSSTEVELQIRDDPKDKGENRA